MNTKPDPYGDLELLTMEELANLWKVKVRTIRELWAQRRLPGVKVGRQVRFRRQDVEGYMVGNGVEALR